MNYKDSAYEALKLMKRPLHSREIIQIAAQKGWLRLKGLTPHLTMSSALYRDINSKKESSRFMQTAPSVFSLNNQFKEAKKPVKPKNPGNPGRRPVMKKLLIGKLEGCPAEIFKDEYKNIRKDEFKSKHGIYALYDKKGRLYYVGRASDLRNRLRQHLKSSGHSGKWDYFSIYFTRTEETARDLEAVILSVSDPKGNKNKPPVLAKDTKMECRIKKEMKRIDKARRQFRKPGKSAKKKTSRIQLQGKGLKKTVSQEQAMEKKPRKRPSLKGLVSLPAALKKEYKRSGKVVHAMLLPSGEIECHGKKYFSPSGAAKAASGKISEGGWTFWTLQNSDGKWITLKDFAAKKPPSAAA